MKYEIELKINALSEAVVEMAWKKNPLNTLDKDYFDSSIINTDLLKTTSLISSFLKFMSKRSEYS